MSKLNAWKIVTFEDMSNEKRLWVRKKKIWDYDGLQVVSTDIYDTSYGVPTENKGRHQDKRETKQWKE